MLLLMMGLKMSRWEGAQHDHRIRRKDTQTHVVGKREVGLIRDLGTSGSAVVGLVVVSVGHYRTYT